MKRALNGTLQLHNVADTEALCRSTLNNWCRKTHARLNPDDTEDAVAYLLAVAWELSLRYDPDKSKTGFRVYATTILGFRCSEWLREDEGRTRWQFSGHTYERERPVVLSLDQPTRNGDDDAHGRTLGDTVAVPAGGVEADRESLAARLERERDRHRARDLAVLNQGLCQRTAA